MTMINSTKPDDDIPSISTLQAKIQHLIRVSKIPHPNDAELAERDTFFVYLRKQGFNSTEMSEIVEGRLAEDTIRKIVAGVKPEEEGVKNRMISLMRRMVSKDLDIKSVEEFIKLEETVLAPHGVTIADVCSFVKDSKEAGYDVNSIVATYKEQKQSGMSIKDLRASLSYKIELESIGLATADLQQISEIAGKNNRDKNSILNSVNAYDCLEVINKEIQSKQAALVSLKEHIESATIEHKKIQLENQHLQHVTGMIEELIEKHKFSIQAIRSLQRAAKKYGQPFEVIEAIDAYGTLDTIKQDIEAKSRARAQLDAEIAERRNAIATLQGQAEAIKNTITGMLEPMSSELTRTYKEGIRVINEHYLERLEYFHKFDIDHGRRLEASQILANDLKILKIVRTLSLFPQESHKVSIEFAITLLNAANNILIARHDRTNITYEEAQLASEGDQCRAHRASAAKLVHCAVLALERGRISSLDREVA